MSNVNGERSVHSANNASWVVPLSSLKAEQLRAVRKTMPPADALTVPLGPRVFYVDTATGVLLALGLISLLTSAGDDGSGIAGFFIFWAIALFGTGQFEKKAPVKADNTAMARELVKAAENSGSDAADTEIHFTRHESGQISAAIPSVGAQWTIVGADKHPARVGLMVSRLPAIEQDAPAASLPAAQQWSQQWLAGRPEVQRRAGTNSTRISSLMGEVAALIDTDVNYEDDDMMRLLETMRTDCDEAVRLYLELTPDEAARPLRSGKTATAELITLLELVRDESAAYRADGALSTGDRLSFLRRLSEQRFTRSDLDLA